MDFALREEVVSTKGPLSGEKIIEATAVTGGCIHDAWKIKLSTGEKFFAKTCPVENIGMLKYEEIGLASLNEKIDPNFLIIPKPIITQKLETAAILLMSWIDINRGNERKLGEGLALMHKHSAEHSQKSFGWQEDGFIGRSTQVGGWRKSWGECFVTLRLAPQLAMAEEWGLCIQKDKLFSKLIEYLDKHDPQPSIVHGDLWKGNTGIHRDGKGIIFDPAIWWADREVDIAMTKLFGGFSIDFYNGYNETYPLAKSHEERSDIYNLYHLLNHANLFGGNYQQSSISTLDKITILLSK
ncbi:MULTISPECIES: fructosamine kinase family protein [Prochlorococcus]|uniref:Predicted kinase, fructosamine/homoserine kinase family n=1 Tax=Prochlorococcus marinus (strain SARG / CCMP1375 / SS120) TaxID=167539 RepID=Q7V9V3_PROMA|nr:MULTISPECIES: fructosamine kinase family protein [Prochlorococcus]AAQ00765.1 Predicted kinase, fructosamine/homoserine kinase family [Prochlorococcus marinus subsp. marinus str. CCMP1375]KGG10740.1 Ribulosamine/erythrulosamine 3-kinase potentially involved in protein deglycation [Prochlorococcus marinus str. LG]KGG21162.1 Ribulosamine/erythrulosamine 3-kinase potentially involved in protein deglycation [Prochlorococcus marinus str. SS2]KGG23986.1 Ribulosamine/erythrulosamine 3-kinase potenti